MIYHQSILKISELVRAANAVAEYCDSACNVHFFNDTLTVGCGTRVEKVDVDVLYNRPTGWGYCVVLSPLDMDRRFKRVRKASRGGGRIVVEVCGDEEHFTVAAHIGDECAFLGDGDMP